VDGNPSARATVLAVLLWPACAACAVLGAILSAILGAVGDRTGGWAALGWAFVGCVLGVGVGGLLLGWIWAAVTNRRRLLPALAVMLLPGAGVVVGLPLILPVPGSSNDALRITVCCAIVVLVTALVFVVGYAARPRTVVSEAARVGRPVTR
jgi:hypothetical protein